MSEATGTIPEQGATQPASHPRLTPTWPSTGPWRRFPGPIVTRDVAKSSRRGGTYWTRLAVAGLLLLVLSATYLSATSWSRLGLNGTTSNIASLQELQRVAPQLFVAGVWFEFVILGLLSVAATSMSICGERQAGTLWALLATPLKSWEIVLGKVMAGGAQMLVLGLLPLPVLLAVRIFGGVSAQAVWMSAALIASTVLSGLVCGVFASVGAGKLTRAAAGGLALMGMQQFGVPLLLLLVNVIADVQVVPLEFFPWITPAAVLGLTSVAQGSLIPGVHLSLLVLSGVGWNLVWTLGLFWVACVRLRRMAAQGRLGLDAAPARRAKRGGQAGTVEGDGTPTPAGNGKVSRRRGGRKGATQGASRVVGERAVRWRECAGPLLAQQSARIAVLVFVLTFAVIDVVRDGVTSTELHHFAGVIGILVATVMTAAAASGTFPSERESRTWDILLTTPLSAREIVLGKFVGALRHGWFGAGLLGLHLALSWVFGDVLGLTLVYSALVVGPTIGLAAALGTLMGLVVKTTQRATTASIGTLVIAWAGVPIALAMVESMVSGTVGRQLFEHAAAGIFTFNPFGMIIMAMEAYGGSGRGVGLESRVDYFGTVDMSYLTLGLPMIVFALGSAGVSWGLLRLATRRLQRMGLRR